MTNVFYFQHLLEIGGIESWFYYIAKKYSKECDIHIFYKSGSPTQIRRLKEAGAYLHHYTNQKIKCKRMIFCFNQEIADNVEAEEYYFVVHGNYKKMRVFPKVSDKITKTITISKEVQDSWKELSGEDSELIYNPIVLDKPVKRIKLMSATRLTEEKGGWRILKIVEELNKHKIPFTWDLYSNQKLKANIEGLNYKAPSYDIVNLMPEYDYVVQLSDTEGYCYTLVESLILGVPVISTDIPVIKEIGLNENNSIVLDLDLSNLNVEEIYKKAGKFKFKYEPPKSEFDKLLIKGKKKLKEYEVKAKIDFTDLENNVLRKRKEVFKVNEYRKQELEDLNIIYKEVE